VHMSIPVRTTVTAVAVTLALAAPTVPLSTADAAAKPDVDAYDTTVSEFELAGPVRVGVRLSRKPTSPVKVTWRTADGSAKAGHDYVAGKGTLVFAKGQRTGSIGVTVLHDEVAESTELFDIKLASRTGRVTDKRVTVSIIDDDVATYTGELTISSRSEHDTGDFYTLETWTLTFQPRMLPVFQGTAWYDDGYGWWELTGSRIREDHRATADCRMMEKEAWTGAGSFFTEPHPDSDVGDHTGNLVLQNFFPQHAGNLGQDPLLHIAVDAEVDGTQYSLEDGSCVPSSYERIERVAMEEAPSEVETDGRGRVPVFDHHVLEDSSDESQLDTYQLDVVGDLAPMTE
jgi:hypothetical protein